MILIKNILIAMMLTSSIYPAAEDLSLDSYYKSPYQANRKKSTQFPDDQLELYSKEESTSASIFIANLLDASREDSFDFGFMLELIDQIPPEHEHRYLKDLLLRLQLKQDDGSFIMFLPYMYAFSEPKHLRVLNRFLIKNYTKHFLRYFIITYKYDGRFLRDIVRARRDSGVAEVYNYFPRMLREEALPKREKEPEAPLVTRPEVTEESAQDAFLHDAGIFAVGPTTLIDYCRTLLSALILG